MTSGDPGAEAPSTADGEERPEAASLVASPEEGAALRAELGHREPAQSARLVHIAREHFEFGCTPAGMAFVVPRDGPYVAHLLRGGRRSLRHELVREFSAAWGRPPNSSALADALLLVEAECLAIRPREVALRVGASGGNLILDLGRLDGRVVEVGPTGWRIRRRSPVLFRRSELI